MSRVKGLEANEAGFIGRIAFWFSKRKVGMVPDSVRITAHHSRLLRAMGSMEMGQEAAKFVEFRLKILAQIKVAMLVGCPF